MRTHRSASSIIGRFSSKPPTYSKSLLRQNMAWSPNRHLRPKRTIWVETPRRCKSLGDVVRREEPVRLIPLRDGDWDTNPPSTVRCVLFPAQSCRRATFTASVGSWVSAWRKIRTSPFARSAPAVICRDRPRPTAPEETTTAPCDSAMDAVPSLESPTATITSSGCGSSDARCLSVDPITASSLSAGTTTETVAVASTWSSSSSSSFGIQKFLPDTPENDENAFIVDRSARLRTVGLQGGSIAGFASAHCAHAAAVVGSAMAMNRRNGAAPPPGDPPPPPPSSSSSPHPPHPLRPLRRRRRSVLSLRRRCRPATGRVRLMVSRPRRGRRRRSRRRRFPLSRRRRRHPRPFASLLTPDAVERREGEPHAADRRPRPSSVVPPLAEPPNRRFTRVMRRRAEPVAPSDASAPSATSHGLRRR